MTLFATKLFRTFTIAGWIENERERDSRMETLKSDISHVENYHNQQAPPPPLKKRAD